MDIKILSAEKKQVTDLLQKGSRHNDERRLACLSGLWHIHSHSCYHLNCFSCRPKINASGVNNEIMLYTKAHIIPANSSLSRKSTT
jgi:hypothetical protein